MSRTCSRSAHPDFPGERLVCCHNPALADERARKRDELLAATEKELQHHRRGHPPRNAGRCAARTRSRCGWARCINQFKMAKHFTSQITDEAFTLHPQPGRHRRRGRPRRHLRAAHQPARPTPSTDDEWCCATKDLADVERFFRTLNSELDVRPIRHRLADRVRAHMFLRMLSYYISWHMKQALAPILFADNDKPAAAAKRADPVAAGPTLRRSAGQGRAQTHPRRQPGAQLHQPARRPGHHLRQPHPTHRRHCQHSP